MQPDVNQDFFNQAVRDGDVDQILLLLRSDAVDVNFRDCTHDLETPMMKLCHVNLRTENTILPVLETVKQSALRVDQQDALGRTLAMHACISGNQAMLKFALQRGCDPTVADRKGKNLAHYLALSGNDSLVDLVLDGLDIGQALRTLDFQGYSPVDLARQKKHSALARKLSNALVSTKKEIKEPTHKGNHVSVRTETDGVHGPPHRPVADQDSVEPTRPPLTRRNARMPVVYRAPAPQDYDHSSGPDDGASQYHGSATSPTSSSSSPATSADSNKQNNFVRSLSLRRSYIAKKTKENHQNSALKQAEIPNQPFYHTLPSSPDHVVKNSNKDPRFGSRDDALSRSISCDADASASRQFIHQMLPNKSPVHSQARLQKDQRLQEEILMDRNNTSGVYTNAAMSPRLRLKQIYNNKQVGLLDLKDDQQGGMLIKVREKMGVGALFEETVMISPLRKLQHYERPSQNSSDELAKDHPRGGEGQVTDRRTERRSSISLPDLRDMTGCLVTSPDAKRGVEDLAPSRKSRITLDDLDRRDNIRNYGTSDENFQLEDGREANSGSDMSLDSNFEDEKPIKRH